MAFAFASSNAVTQDWRSTSCDAVMKGQKSKNTKLIYESTDKNL
jgi:hypothetical protein